MRVFSLDWSNLSGTQSYMVTVPGTASRQKPRRYSLFGCQKERKYVTINTSNAHINIITSLLTQQKNHHNSEQILYLCRAHIIKQWV